MFDAIDSLVSGLHKEGVVEVIICPGSRNAPLIISFVRSALFQTQAIADERSAGFIALGKAIRTGKPVALLCTSGSALTNFYPAVVEAYYQRIPLIVISADRPSELIDRWDGQTIRQKHLFGNHVRGSFSTPEEYNDPRQFYFLGREAVSKSQAEIPGPVHLNIPLKEPLYPAADRLFLPLDLPFETHQKAFEKTEVFPDLKGKKVLVIRGFDPVGITRQINYPAQFTDMMSGSVQSPVPEQFWMNGNELLKASFRPEVLLTDGTAILPKTVKNYLRRYPVAEHYHFSQTGDMADPFFTNPVLIRADLADFVSGHSHEWHQEYVRNWEKVTSVLKEKEGEFWQKEGNSWNELSAAQSVIQSLKKQSILHLANSMPVRFASLLRPDVARVYCNRGTSGIDGCVSTALGMATSDQEEHVLMIGDVAFFYDSNALWNHLNKGNFRIILQNNGGGGIFRLIDGPASQPELETYFETSHQRDARALCENLNCSYLRAANRMELEEKLLEFYQTKGPVVLEIVTNKVENQSFFNQYKQYIHAIEISVGNH